MLLKLFFVVIENQIHSFINSKTSKRIINAVFLKLLDDQKLFKNLFSDNFILSHSNLTLKRLTSRNISFVEYIRMYCTHFNDSKKKISILSLTIILLLCSNKNFTAYNYILLLLFLLMLKFQK